MGPGIIDESTARRLLEYRARGGLLNSDEIDALISYHCACAVRAERDSAAKTWTTTRPTPGTWWLSVHPQERGRVAWDASPVLACNVSGQTVEIESRSGSRIVTKRFHVDDAFLLGAQWQIRETPADPFSPTPLSSDGTR